MRDRRWSGEWAQPAPQVPARIDVLIPTVGREAELAVTLAGLAAQDGPQFRVVVSDQSDAGDSAHAPAVASMIRVLRAQGRAVEVLPHLPRRGMAEQRQFLLDNSRADRVLFLDDDVWCEPGLLTRLDSALTELGCGFVGSAVQGLSFLDDVRPDEQAAFEPWEGRVVPEDLFPGAPEVARLDVHNAANLTHIAGALDVPKDGWRAYKVAWVGACVLFDRAALVEVGGFSFWPELPPEHSGEDVVAQWRVMARFGGAGILPSGAVHLEAPTTVVNRRVDAPDVVLGG